MIHQILGSRMHVVKLWILPKCDQFCWKLTVSVHWHTVLFCKRLSDIRIFVYIYGRKTKKTHICIQKYIFIYTPLHPQWGEGHHGIPCYYAKDYHMYAYSFITWAHDIKIHTSAYPHIHINIHVLAPTVGRRTPLAYRVITQKITACTHIRLFIWAHDIKRHTHVHTRIYI